MFKKGKLVFIDSLQLHGSPHVDIPYFTARALVITVKDDQHFGTVETLKISDLISKLSNYVYDGVNTQEAHKLYTWPKNLGDMNAWAESKKIFLEQHVMNFPIKVSGVKEATQITWEFISPEDFKKIPEGLQASPEFQQYLDQIDSYFFLRKNKNEPV